MDSTAQHLVIPKTVSGERHGVLTVLAGPQPGKLIPIGEGELTIGRGEDARVVLEDTSLSRLHARVFRANARYFVEDLKSTNGTFIDGNPITEPHELSDGTRIQLGAHTVLRFAMRDHTEVEATRRVYEATVRDRLTGVFNRHFLDERLFSEMSYAQRHGTSLSVLFVDADHFKRINDTYGHAAGDEVLRRIAALLQQTMRSEDVVARYGGEEFVLVVRGIPTSGVMTLAERVRSAIAATRIDLDGTPPLSVTVSIGVATQTADCMFAGADELLAAADAALYRAKEGGRNRVVLA
jgi:diguanylate cyclase (GGDEF)-like protein